MFEEEENSQQKIEEDSVDDMTAGELFDDMCPLGTTTHSYSPSNGSEVRSHEVFICCRNIVICLCTTVADSQTLRATLLMLSKCFFLFFHLPKKLPAKKWLNSILSTLLVCALSNLIGRKCIFIQNVKQRIENEYSCGTPTTDCCRHS